MSWRLPAWRTELRRYIRSKCSPGCMQGKHELTAVTRSQHTSPNGKGYSQREGTGQTSFPWKKRLNRLGDRGLGDGRHFVNSGDPVESLDELLPELLAQDAEPNHGCLHTLEEHILEHFWLTEPVALSRKGHQGLVLWRMQGDHKGAKLGVLLRVGRMSSSLICHSKGTSQTRGELVG